MFELFSKKESHVQHVYEIFHPMYTLYRQLQSCRCSQYRSVILASLYVCKS